jgi:hypothetical protein
VRLDEQIAEQPVDGFGRVADLVIAPRATHQLQPVQRALPASGSSNFRLPLRTANSGSVRNCS